MDKKSKAVKLTLQGQMEQPEALSVLILCVIAGPNCCKNCHGLFMDTVDP